MDIPPNEGMFRPLKKKRYSDQIAEVIQRRILKHHLEIGTGLPSELDLAKEFQVSRSVIREALRILEDSGLVKITKGPSGGIFVANGYHKPIKKTLDNLVLSGEVRLDHLFDVRLLLEPHIAEEAALHARDSDIETLRDLIDDSSRNLEDPLHLKQNNLMFHLQLARASGNPVFALLLESVIELLIERSLSFLDPTLERKFFQAHEAIFNMISERKPKEARRLMEKDIMDVKEGLKKSRKANQSKIENGEDISIP